ncbi:MAG: pseudouridine synthase [Rhodoblastus sp.]
MSENDKRQGGRPFKPGAKKESGARGAGKAFNKPAGKAFGKPAGKAFGKPAGKAFGKPAGKAFDKPAGKAFNKPFSPRKGPKAGAPGRETPAPKAFQGERIAKAMARAGACSRRAAEEWIAQGRVSVNGRTLDSPAFNVTSADRIAIDGRPMAARDKTRLYLFHKPRGLVTTDRDPEGRRTIFDYLAERYPDLPRLMTVGRLDINTEGLLLLTNDGGLARTLELPQTGWLRRYRVRAHGETDQAALDTLARGVTVDDVQYAPIEARYDRAQGANVWITLGLREGKNREVRRVLGSIGLDVNRLIRVSYGPFQLGELGEGVVEEVRTRVLREQLGPSLIAQSLADFDAAVQEDEGRPPGRERKHSRERESFSQARPERGIAERGRPERGRLDREGFSREKFGRRDDRQEPEVKRERPKAGPRKHVSALRVERDKRMKKDDRVKIERGETADRKGRAVKVERVVPAIPRADEESRNGRRFKAERGGDRPMRRAPRAEGADRFSRNDRSDARGSQGKRTGSPYARREGGAGKTEWGKGEARGEARDKGPRPPRPTSSGGRFGGDKPRQTRDGPNRGGSNRGGPGSGSGRGGPRSGGPRRPRETD